MLSCVLVVTTAIIGRVAFTVYRCTEREPESMWAVGSTCGQPFLFFCDVTLYAFFSSRLRTYKYFFVDFAMAATAHFVKTSVAERPSWYVVGLQVHHNLIVEGMSLVAQKQSSDLARTSET